MRASIHSCGAPHIEMNERVAGAVSMVVEDGRWRAAGAMARVVEDRATADAWRAGVEHRRGRGDGMVCEASEPAADDE